MKNKIMTAMFAGLLAAGCIGGMVLPDKYYSETERRKLSQLPQVSVESIKNGNLGDEVENYLSDQFPMRDAWVTLKTLTERTFGRTDSDGVYFASDGYLIEAHQSIKKKGTVTNIGAIADFTKDMEKQGIMVRTMLVPTASAVLKDKLPAFAPEANQQAVVSYAAKQGVNIVDVTGTLTTHADEYIYYKTDHHWTSLGAYYAYCAYEEALGKKADAPDAWTHERLSDDFRGTTYNKVNYPLAPYDTIEAWYKKEHSMSCDGGYTSDSIYERKYLNTSDKYAVFFNSNQATTVVKGEGQGRILVIKDSYANTFAQFLVDDYEETHMIDLRFFTGSVKEYIAENGITEALVLYNIPNLAEDENLVRITG